jgi:hypothetical protein
MKIINKLKRKILCLIERIKLSDSEYLTMKAQSQMYKAMMSTIEYSSDSEYEDAFDDNGVPIKSFLKARTATVHINITDMLAEGGITFNKNVVKLDVTGL